MSGNLIDDNNKIDISLIHTRDYEAGKVYPGMNVFFSHESPANNPSNGFDNNPLISYMPNPHGLYVQYDKFELITNETDKHDFWSQQEVNYSIDNFKKDGLLIIASNCNTNSDRDTLIAFLKLHINITYFGKCGEGRIDDDQRNSAFKTHKFYLAFENSVCDSYVTEKFWNIKKLIVPIVLNRNYTLISGAPNDSYIAVDDFENLNDFVKHLKYLMANTTEYKKFFSWTKLFKKTEASKNITCALCEMAYEVRENNTLAKRMVQSYKEWNTNSQCLPDYATKLIPNYEKLKLFINKYIGYIMSFFVLLTEMY